MNLKKADSIGHLLGFKPQILVDDEVYQSGSPVSIIKVNSLKIKCNIPTAAHINDPKVHTIYTTNHTTRI